MRWRDFLDWLNFKELKLRPLEIIKGLLAFIFYLIINPIIITIVAIIVGIISRVIFVRFFMITYFLIFISAIFSAFVFATSIGWVYGLYKKDENEKHESFKNFTIGFFIINFLLSVLIVLSSIKRVQTLEFIVGVVKVPYAILISSFVYYGCILSQKD